jgi:glutathione reductase (NADPH)
MKTYDVTFIGSGHAAWHAALTLQMDFQVRF